MTEFFLRVGKLLHWVGFLIGLFLGFITTFWGYGFFVGILFFLIGTGAGAVINYLLSGNTNFIPKRNSIDSNQDG